MLKYDQLFNSSARNWEAANSQNQDIQRWPGHCLGGAVASIMLAEPIPAPGSGFTQDELKSLWAELGENHYNHQIGDYANDIPPARPGRASTPPTPTPLGSTTCSRPTSGATSKTSSATSGLSRLEGPSTRSGTTGSASTSRPTTPSPGKGERSVRLEVEIHANSGSNLNNEDPKPRVNKYEYIIVYGLDGKVDLTNPTPPTGSRSAARPSTAPLNILEVVSTRWAGHNPYITEANVRSIDLANGGARPGSPAPPRRPGGPSTATRPAEPRSSPATPSPGDASGASPRRGLFRIFRPLSQASLDPETALPDPDPSSRRTLGGPGSIASSCPRKIRRSRPMIRLNDPTPSNCPTVRVAGFGISVKVVQVLRATWSISKTGRFMLPSDVSRTLPDP